MKTFKNGTNKSRRIKLIKNRQTKFKLKKRKSRKLGGSQLFTQLKSAASNGLQSVSSKKFGAEAAEVFSGVGQQFMNTTKSARNAARSAASRFGNTAKDARNAASRFGNTAKGATYASLGTAKDFASGTMGAAKSLASGTMDTAKSLATGTVAAATGTIDAAKSVAVPLGQAGYQAGKVAANVGRAFTSSEPGIALTELGKAVYDTGIGGVQLATATVESVKVILKASKIALQLSSNTAKSALISSAYTANAITKGFFRTTKLLTMASLVCGKTLGVLFDIALNSLDTNNAGLNAIKDECMITLGKGTSKENAAEASVRMDPQNACIVKYIDFLTKTHNAYMINTTNTIKTMQTKIKSDMNLIRGKLIEIGCKRSWYNFIRLKNNYVCKKKGEKDEILIEDIVIDDNGNEIMENGKKKTLNIPMSTKYKQLVELQTKLITVLPQILNDYTNEYNNVLSGIKTYSGNNMNDDIFNSINKYIIMNSTKISLFQKIYESPVDKFSKLLEEYIRKELITKYSMRADKTEEIEVKKKEATDMFKEVGNLNGEELQKRQGIVENEVGKLEELTLPEESTITKTKNNIGTNINTKTKNNIGTNINTKTKNNIGTNLNSKTKNNIGTNLNSKNNKNNIGTNLNSKNNKNNIGTNLNTMFNPKPNTR